MYWAAAGGAPGANVIWEEGAGKERLNKRAALLALPEEHFTSIVNDTSQTPRLYSKAAPKFENGKIRAIWNTSLEHYVYQAYLLDIFDRSCISGSWNAAANNAADELAARATRLELLSHPRHQVGFMWDYSDFNINHSSDALHLLFHELGNLLLEGGSIPNDPDATTEALDDIQRYSRWVLEAKDNMFIFNPESGFGAEVVRSLQSGERATAFTNTMLNRAYKLMHNYYCTAVFGRPLLLTSSWHQGDDVFDMTRTVLDGVYSAYIYNLLGFAGQTYKITLDYGGRGEFLRLSYDPHTATVAGYPFRTFAGLIGGEFFREVIADPGDRAMAFLDQVSDANRRGCLVSPTFLDILIKRNAQISFTDESGVTHRVVPDLRLLLTPALFGGYGTSSLAPTKTFARPLFARALGSIAPGSAQQNLSRPLLRPLAFVIPCLSDAQLFCSTNPSLAVCATAFYSKSRVSVLSKKPEEFAAYARSRPFPRDQVLLVTSLLEVPGDYYVHALFKAIQSSTRAVADAAQAERLCVLNTFYYATSLELSAHILAQIEYMNVQYPLLSALPASTRAFESFESSPRPQYMPPKVDIDLFLDLKSVAGLPDAQRIAQAGGARLIRRALSAITHDCLPGAYPGQALSNSISTFARDLNDYLSTVREGPIVQPPLISPVFFRGLDLFVAPTFSTLAFGNRSVRGLQQVNPPGRAVHVPLPRNAYGSAQMLVPLLGLSAFSSLKVLLEITPPRYYPGQLGRLYALLASKPAQAFSDVPYSIQDALAPLTTINVSQLLDVIHSTVGYPQTAATADQFVCSRLYSFLLGECALLPAPSANVSPQLLTVGRHLALSWTLTRQKQILALPQVEFAFYISACEYLILAYSLRYYTRYNSAGLLKIVRILS
jgi:hypothetical protein